MGPPSSFHHPVNVECLAQWVRPDDRILDFGCGYGRVLGLLHQHGYHDLIGVDAASAMIADARRRFPAITFEHCAQPPSLDLPAGSVGAVLLFTVLTCVPPDEGQRGIVREIERVLRPGGLLYISDLWLQSDARNSERYLQGQVKYGTYGVFDLAKGVTVRHHDRQWIDELTAAYQRAALENFEVETMNGHKAHAFQWFGHKRAV